MRKFLLFIALMIFAVGLNAQSIGDNTTINYEGYSLKFTVTSVANSECEVVGYTRPTEAMAIEIPSKVIIQGKEFNVTSIGVKAFNSSSTTLWKITSITIPNSITSIGENAFFYCTMLTNITIPNSVISIGSSAFHGCTGLEAVTLSESLIEISNSAFYNCSKLSNIILPSNITTIGSSAFYGCKFTSIIIPNSVKTIGENAFYIGTLKTVSFEENSQLTTLSGFQSTSLETITIPNTVTTLGQNAFSNCSSLSNVTLNEGLLTIGSSAFQGCTRIESMTIPNTVTSIGSSAFKGCTKLASIVIPNSVTAIGSSAFQGCTRIESMTISNTVTSIGSSAFGGCTKLASIVIPNSVTSIGSSAFQGCTGLTNVTLSNNMETIALTSFCGCTKLKSITIPGKVRSIEGEAFSGCKELTNVFISKSVENMGCGIFNGCIELTDVVFEDGSKLEELGSNNQYYNGVFKGCTRLTNMVLPEGLKKIAVYTFEGCTRLENVTIPSSVEEIGSYAFYGCSELRSVTLPDDIETIEASTFLNCSKLSNVTIPSRTTSIGTNAFKGCVSFTSVTIPNRVETISANAFSGCTGVTSISFGDNPELTTLNGFDGCTSLTNITIPNSVKTVNSGAFENCTALASISFGDNPELTTLNGFDGCTSLTNITIPNTVTTLGQNAFSNCSSLSNVTLNKGLLTIRSSAFQGCTRIESITIPNTVTRIYRGAFYNCNKLSNVTFEENSELVELGYDNNKYGTFENCTSLTSITIPKSVTHIYGNEFGECTNLETVIFEEGSKLEQLGEGVYPSSSNNYQGPFYKCTSLKNIIIPESVAVIGSGCFYLCESLVSINIPKGVTKIGAKTFQGTSLVNVELPAGITYVGDYAFAYCQNLKKVVLPSTLKNIHNYAFSDCRAIETIRIYAETPPTMGTNAFYLPDNIMSAIVLQVPEIAVESYKSKTPWKYFNITTFPGTGSTININYGSYALDFVVTNIEPAECKVSCSSNPASPTAVNIPGIVLSNGITYKVTEVADNAFLNCTNVTDVTMQTGIKIIGESAFSGCTSLNNMVIPEGVERLKESAFAGCTSMTNISIPSTTLLIEDECFSNCTSLLTMRCDAMFVPETAANAFNYIPISLNIQVPANAVNAYKNAEPWRNYNITKYYPYQIGDHTVEDYDGYSLKYTVKNLEPAEFEVSCSTKPTTMKTISIPRNITYMDTEFEVTSIAASGFASCGLLKGVEISDKIETIGDKAFASCMNLEIIKCHAEEVPTTAMNAFENLSSGLSIQVPAASLEAYQVAEPWSNFNVTTLPEVGMSSIVDYDGYSLKFMITNLQPAECEVICSTKPLRRMSISIPATATIGGEIYNVTSLGEYAFANATNISTIKCHIENVPTTASTAFSNVSQSMKIQVPSNSVSSYQANAIWNKFDISSGFYSTITATSNNNYYGTVTGGGNYTDGTTATLKATASEDCSFISWTENGEVVSNNAQYNFVVNDDRELVANFLSGNYWVADVSNYPSRMTVVGQIQIDGVDQNVTTLEVGAFCGYELRGSARAKYNSASGKYLVQFEIGGDANETISFKLYNHQTATEMTLIAPENINFVANGITGDTNNPHILNFVSKVNITAEVNPSDIGTIDGTGIYTIGDEVTLTASTTSSEYLFVSWTENGVVVSVNETYSFIADKNRNLIANYSINNYWNVDDSPFNSNMTIIAVVQIDDVELNSSNYEVGAFCNGELRGSERLKLEQDLDRYFMYLTVYGETNDLISFKLYDHSTQTVSDLTHLEKINFEVNGTIGNLMEPYTFNFLSGVTVSVICNPNQAGTVSGTGKYPLESTATLTATANDGFVFKNWTLNGEVVSTNVTYSFIVEQATELVANFNYVHETELREGWTWYSTYVNVSGSEGLNMMKEDLAESAIQIKGQNNFVNNQNGIWYGQLNGLSSDQMYMIHMSEAATLEMTGELIDPSECPITLSTNWKWISYPLNHSMNLVTALSNYTPSNGDYIKSQNNGFAQYYSSLGWRGTLNSLIPGQGYMYQNTSGSVRTLVFADNNTKEMTKENVTTENNLWTPNESKYPTNMTMIAVVESDSNFEVAAFSDGECRGSARPVHIEELDKNIVFMTIYGEGDETINFRYYDINDDEEYVITNTMIFGANATVGDLMDPYVLKLATVNIDEHSENVINIYPNPADRNAEIHFATECEKVEVYNSLGVKISEYENVSHIDGIETSGVYMIKVIMNGNVKYDRIVVR